MKVANVKFKLEVPDHWGMQDVQSFLDRLRFLPQDYEVEEPTRDNITELEINLTNKNKGEGK